MTGLFLDISFYIPDEEEMAVDSALYRLEKMQLEEEYYNIPSKANDEAVRARLLR